MAVLSDEEALRSAFWAPCQSRKQLQNWVFKFLGVDLADGIICDDDTVDSPSNSSPLDLCWEVYVRAMRGDPNFQRVLAYAARDCGKTLVASILEILCLFHLGRNVVHLAANLQQSGVCAGYLEKYLQRPILRDYVTVQNSRKIEIAWYQSQDTRYRIDPEVFKRLAKSDPREGDKWHLETREMSIAVATPGGVNGMHGSFFVIDECDLIPPTIYKEANVGITSETRDGKPAVTLIISTRKYSFGQVQKEIDEAHRTRINIRHWNLIDMARRCPPSRHLPDEPRIPIYTSNDYLNAIKEDDYEVLDEVEKNKYERIEGYTGCLQNCRLFSVCRGRLATKQKNNTRMLKSLDHVTEKLGTSDPEFAKAQLLCWKPGTVGLVYPFLTPHRHLVNAAKMAEIITGDVPKKGFGVSDLLKLFKENGVTFHAGMDFGFTHNFSVVLGALWGNTIFIFKTNQQAGLEISQKIELCDRNIRDYDPMIAPDQAYPSDIKSFRRAGYRMMKFKKDVQLGIDSVRAKVLPALGAEPEIYFLADDPGTVHLFGQLTKYHFMLDAQGDPTDEPDKDDDDGPDALRYLCQVLFGKRIHKRPRRRGEGNDTVQLRAEAVREHLSTQEAVRLHNEETWRKQILESTHTVGTGSSYKKGKFFFSGG